MEDGKFTKEMEAQLRILAGEVISKMEIGAQDRYNVFSRKRGKRWVAIRKAVARTLREMGLSYPEIGRALGRDHSTIMSYLKEKRVKQNRTECYI